MKIVLILNRDFGFGSKGLSVSLLVHEIWSVEVNLAWLAASVWPTLGSWN